MFKSQYLTKKLQDENVGWKGCMEIVWSITCQHLAYFLKGTIPTLSGFLRPVAFCLILCVPVPLIKGRLMKYTQ